MDEITREVLSDIAKKAHESIMRERFHKAVSLAIFFNRHQGNSGWNYKPDKAQRNLKIACAVIGIPYKIFPNLNPETISLKG